MNIKIKLGCDIVDINRFKKIVEHDKKVALRNLFSDHELNSTDSVKSLAGIFAAKEAVIKALELNAGSWKLIEIIKQSNGKPVIKLLDFFDKNIISHDVSISHDGDYAFATTCFLLNGDAL